MATGMQTGMRTSSRMTAGRGAPAAPQGGGLSKVKETWNSLSKGMRIGIISLIALLCVGGGTFMVVSSQNKDVDLYTTKLTASDCTEIATQLTNLGISHKVSVTGDGIMIHPKQRSKALAQLAQLGLPKHPIKTPNNTSSDGLSGKTAKEQEQLRQQLLEGELTESLRQFDGVADAYIKIARPEQTFFKGDEKPVTATVNLKLTPGTKLGEQQVRSIVHLVAFSVPELDKKNVKVIDGSMNDLTAMIDESEGGGSSGKQGEQERAKAKELTSNAQSMLDGVFGPGKTKVAVNCEMDFSKVETNRRTVGGPQHNGEVVTGKQTMSETYDKGNSGAKGADGGLQLNGEEADQTAGGPGKAKGGSDYANVKEVTKYDHDSTTTKEVRITPIIRKLTCSVACNNLKDDQVAKIAGLVQNAIGYDEARGDTISVQSIPFADPTQFTPGMPGMGVAGAAPTNPAVAKDSEAGKTAGQMGIALSVLSLGALGLIGVFLMKQHSSQVGRSQLLLDNNFSGGTSTDIADLRHGKDGKSSGSAATQVNTSDALEQLAKEKPTDVAKMLKSTWLNG